MSEQIPASVRNDSPISDISIHGVIKASLYEEVKRYLMPPSVKIIWIIVVVVQVVMSGYGLVAEHNWINAAMLVLGLALLLFLYRHMQRKIVRNVCKDHPVLRQDGYHVLITFGSNIRLLNHTTGAQRTLEYKSIYSTAVTEHAIVCFARKDGKRRYLLIPLNEVTDEQRAKILEKIAAKAGKLKKRW